MSAACGAACTIALAIARHSREQRVGVAISYRASTVLLFQPTAQQDQLRAVRSCIATQKQTVLQAHNAVIARP